MAQRYRTIPLEQERSKCTCRPLLEVNHAAMQLHGLPCKGTACVERRACARVFIAFSCSGCVECVPAMHLLRWLDWMHWACALAVFIELGRSGCVGRAPMLHL